MSLLPDSGHDKALEAVTLAVEGQDKDRFAPIVRGLILKNNEQLRVGFIQFHQEQILDLRNIFPGWLHDSDQRSSCVAV